MTLWYCAEGQPSWSLSFVQRMLSLISFEAAGSLSYPRMSALSPLLWQLHYMHSLIGYSHRLGVPCAAAAPHPCGPPAVRSSWSVHTVLEASGPLCPHACFNMDPSFHSSTFPSFSIYHVCLKSHLSVRHPPLHGLLQHFCRSYFSV